LIASPIALGGELVITLPAEVVRPCGLRLDTLCESRFGGAMRFPSARVLFAWVVGAGSLFLMGVAGLSRSSGRDYALPANQPAKIIVDYPLDGSVFPPEITPPTFLWRDASETAKRWVLEVTFAHHTGGIRVEAPGEHLQMGEIDPEAGSRNELPQLTPEQAATRTWRPDGDTWAKIKRLSVKSPATISLTGFADDDSKLPVSAGSVTISTSLDPVGAPIFYRDVPLMTVPHTEKGSIQPLPTSALPLIKWQLRNIGEPQSRVVMEKLYTCANCHSFSRDGKTLGLDVDGPKNDKGLYALVPVAKNMAIRNQDVIRWSSFQENLEAKSSEPTVKRFGFMSQISPDGRYVVTSIGPPAAGNTHQNENPSFAPGLSDRLFSMNYQDIRFTQVFYPTRGILAWYDRKEKKLRPLPGADDPRFVQTSAFWSPDGKYLIFSREEARDPYPPGAEKPMYANDPNETQIQYDLYRIPFNEGRGGKAEPVVGASGNGMSNNFPKVSPDGRWIVFVQCHNGLLMRPDSKLYIVPFAGGKARLMKCNTSLMNSWHTFSPNGRWLAFSSKSRSPYTQLMLTHIDDHGNDTPAILVDNTTAANRAVNIPEFVNVPPDGLEQIDPQAMQFYRVATNAFELMEKNQMAEAIQEWRKALQLDPDDAEAHFSLAVALTGNNQEREAVEEYRTACTLDTHQAAWLAHLAASLAQTGDLYGAVVNYRKSLALDPSSPGAEADLGSVLFETGQTQEGYEHLRKAVEMAPDFPDGHNQMGTALAKMGRMDEAVDELRKAITLLPTSVEYRFNLGFVLGLRGDFPGAVAALQKAVELSEGKDWRCLAALADAYNRAGRSAEAIQSAHQALDLALQEHDEELEKNLRNALERYERDAAKAQPQ
jgi:Flp pilus assembly protein TadD